MLRPMILLTFGVAIFDVHTRLARLEADAPLSAAVCTAVGRRHHAPHGDDTIKRSFPPKNNRRRCEVRLSVDMKFVTFTLLLSTLEVVPFVSSFAPLSSSRRVVVSSTTTHRSTSTEEQESENKKKKRRRLGLITFDLDDTLYPIAPVLDEANAAFSSAMSNFGYVDIRPSDIVETGKEIRATLTPPSNEEEDDGGIGPPLITTTTTTTSSDPLKPRTVNHKEIRMAAIRKEMEGFILRTKLRQTAADWATEVESITGPVRKSAEK